MRLDIYHHQHDPMLYLQLDRLEKLLMALSPEVQASLAGVRQLNAIVPSIDQGIKALQAQNAALAEQIANSSPSLSQEDKDALLEMTTDTSNMLGVLQADIPANTAAASGNSPGTSGAA